MSAVFATAGYVAFTCFNRVPGAAPTAGTGFAVCANAVGTKSRELSCSAAIPNIRQATETVTKIDERRKEVLREIPERDANLHPSPSLVTPGHLPLAAWEFIGFSGGPTFACIRRG